MTNTGSVFNHVGLCVADRARSRRFYEGLLGFQFWWELDPPDAATEKLLQLQPPLGTHATYLVRDGLVLELIDFAARQPNAGAERVMDHIGLTHISFSVSDLAGVLDRVAEFGGSVEWDTVSDLAAMVRDPDGQLLELLTDGWSKALPPRPEG
jgi:catechol 2,3-dioxygenase-like lactoylglutathione lyase family enzyme